MISTDNSGDDSPVDSNRDLLHGFCQGWDVLQVITFGGKPLQLGDALNRDEQVLNQAVVVSHGLPVPLHDVNSAHLCQ